MNDDDTTSQLAVRWEVRPTVGGVRLIWVHGDRLIHVVDEPNDQAARELRRLSRLERALIVATLEHALAELRAE